MAVATVSGRALKDALYILSNQLSCVINYEDPPYQHASTIRLLTPDGPQVPAQHSIFFTYDPKRPKAEIIQNLLEEYYKRDNTVIFKLAKSENLGKLEFFSVVPFQVKTQSGSFAEWKSPLDNEISLTATDSYFGIAARIAELATQGSSEKIRAVEGQGRGIFFEEKVSFTANNKSARSCLNRLIQHFSSKHTRSVIWGVNRSLSSRDGFLWFRTDSLPAMGEADALRGHMVGAVAIRTESSRPLADALQLMEQNHAKVAIFEDTPYLCPCAVMRDRAGNPYTPRGGILEYSYPSDSKLIQVLIGAVENFNNHNQGEFVVEPVGEAFYVHPTEFMNEKEMVLPHAPLLATSISLPTEPKPASEILKALCASLAAQTKWKVTLGELTPAFAQVLPYDGGKRPAVEHLAALSQKVGGNVSWQLLYEPRLAGYVLNAHRIGETTKRP